MKKLFGTGVAIVTPFNKDLSIDFNSLKSLTNHIISQGANYIVVQGTTSETPTLTEQEKQEVINTIVQTNNGRVPLVLGIGGNHTQEVISKIQYTDLSKFAAILSVSPYYNKPSQEGIYEHYKTIAENCPTDIILYNVPSRTASNIAASTTVKLAKDFKNIIAIKEASGNLEQCMDIIKHKPNDFFLISGDDKLTLPMITMGAKGVISVIANAYSNKFSKMINNCLNKNFNTDIHYELLYLMDLIFEEGNPVGIKSLLSSLNLISNDIVRLPLVNTSKDLTEKIQTEIKSLV